MQILLFYPSNWWLNLCEQGVHLWRHMKIRNTKNSTWKPLLTSLLQRTADFHLALQTFWVSSKAIRTKMSIEFRAHLKISPQRSVALEHPQQQDGCRQEKLYLSQSRSRVRIYRRYKRLQTRVMHFASATFPLRPGNLSYHLGNTHN